MNTLETALALHADGISVIPVAHDGTKRPRGAWKEYQSTRATIEQLREWFAPGSPTGLGIVTGAVSGNLEMAEIEGAAAHRIPELAAAAARAGVQVLWEALNAGWVEYTPGGGIHWFYRVHGTVPGNTKLATAADRTVLAETRGEGGYSVAAPSNGTVHPSGGKWQLLRGGPDTCPYLTMEEREDFHAILATLTEHRPEPVQPRTSQPAGEASTGSPGDDYERRTEWADILGPHGWTALHSHGQTQYWRRPGKTIGQSASTGHAGDRDRLYVFTSSTEFEQERPYTKFGAYALLNHGGDHAAAAAQLRRDGYGDPATAPAANRLQPFDTGFRKPESGTTPPSPGRTIDLTAAATIAPRRVRWLWDGRLALGTLGLLAGRQGLGKSTLAYWLAAQLTRGTLPGEYEGTPRAVLVCATEDSWEHTIVPRLIAADADLNRVYRVEVVTEDGLLAPLSLPRDNRGLETAALEKDAALLILDPIISRLGELDTHRDAEVRMALEPLVAVAGRARMAILGLIHHNKSAHADPLQSVMGSTAFSAVARSVHTVVPDPDDDTDMMRLFGTPKNNLGRTNLPTLAFTVESHAVPTEDDGPAWTGRISWHGEHEGSIADAMRQAQEDHGGDRSATTEAADWLQDHLTMRGGTDEWKNIKRDGAKAGHSESTLKRAKKKLHLGSRTWGYPRTALWYFDTAAPIGSLSPAPEPNEPNEPNEGGHPIGPPIGPTPLGRGGNEPNEPNGGLRGPNEPHSGQSVHSVHSDGCWEQPDLTGER